MPINSRPGNQPDPNDMAGTFESDGEADMPATDSPHPTEEEVATKLGDFA